MSVMRVDELNACTGCTRELDFGVEESDLYEYFMNGRAPLI